MTDVRRTPSGRAVPRGRLSRLGQFGRLAGGVAGGVLAEGARRLANGERPHMRDALLTPANFIRVADRLSHLRGAAMKLGQMISLDAGDMLPPELADIMARFRDNAHHMRLDQLQRVLAKEWGRDWRDQFRRFDPHPIAAASIGQVHRATTHDGRDLAIKVQYPGVRESIDADVDNVATLLRVSGLLPRGLDIAPLLDAAKQQLAEETDYEREGAQMVRFRTLLADTPEIAVPELVPALTTSRILAMSFVEGRAIETLESAPQALRDTIARSVIKLVLRELFEFGLMQTDPNFANFRYDEKTARLVLLDFGAARAIDAATAEGYRRLLAAGFAQDRAAVREAAVVAGFIGAGAVDRHRARVDGMIDVILRIMNREDAFDFGDRGFVAGLRDEGFVIAQDRAAWHLPPTEMLFVQRKISGTALLAARLRARVDLRELTMPWLVEHGFATA